jgi:membrane-bound lytic murein transglycosylase A
LLLAGLVSGCVSRPPAPPPSTPAPTLTLAPTSYAALSGWSEDDVGAAVPALLNSCGALAKLGEDAPVGSLAPAGRAADWRAPCAAAVQLGPQPDGTAARHFFETWFMPYVAGNNGNSAGLFTGYYEAEAHGARQRGGAYATPLLRRPADLVMVELGLFRPAWHGERIAGRVVDGRLRPYDSRAQIDAGALDRDHLALLWLDDPIDAFFLQIQGSGRVHLPDGSAVRVQYDGQNGWPYVAIGKLLVDRHELTLDQVSMAAIRTWLKTHPAEAQGLMAQNPSYVFFKESRGNGPVGSEGVVLTPGRSLAVDRDFIPLGIPVWLDAAQGDEHLRRLVVAQDTGGAIRGPTRGDLFWGFGDEAEARAGNMRARGAYYILLPRGIALRAAR